MRSRIFGNLSSCLAISGAPSAFLNSFSASERKTLLLHGSEGFFFRGIQEAVEFTEPVLLPALFQHSAQVFLKLVGDLVADSVRKGFSPRVNLQKQTIICPVEPP